MINKSRGSDFEINTGKKGVGKLAARPGVALLSNGSRKMEGGREGKKGQCRPLNIHLGGKKKPGMSRITAMGATMGDGSSQFNVGAYFDRRLSPSLHLLPPQNTTPSMSDAVETPVVPVEEPITPTPSAEPSVVPEKRKAEEDVDELKESEDKVEEVPAVTKAAKVSYPFPFPRERRVRLSPASTDTTTPPSSSRRVAHLSSSRSLRPRPSLPRRPRMARRRCVVYISPFTPSRLAIWAYIRVGAGWRFGGSGTGGG